MDSFVCLEFGAAPRAIRHCSQLSIGWSFLAVLRGLCSAGDPTWPTCLLRMCSAHWAASLVTTSLVVLLWDLLRCIFMLSRGQNSRPRSFHTFCVPVFTSRGYTPFYGAYLDLAAVCPAIRASGVTFWPGQPPTLRI